jgi:hypothetical protein
MTKSTGNKKRTMPTVKSKKNIRGNAKLGYSQGSKNYNTLKKIEAKSQDERENL